MHEDRVKNAQRAFKDKDIEGVKHAHTKEAIAQNINEHNHESNIGEYLGDFVYGGIDGAVTTFAVVAGAQGADLAPFIVIILGFSNLIADGFSMACGSYLSEKTEKDYVKKERAREEWEVENCPEGEREEIREIYKQKGFTGKDLEKAVEIITSNKKVWVDTMMVDELELIESNKNPIKAGILTYAGFLAIGIIPLLPYTFASKFPIIQENTFVFAIIMTMIGLFVLGIIKRHVTKKNIWISALETMFIGGIAAFIAFYIGDLLEWLVLSS